jgi:hypothetical protein
VTIWSEGQTVTTPDPTPPTFRSKLLNELRAAFVKRRKALSYNGELSFTHEQDDSRESLEVHYYRICGAYVRLRVAGSNETLLELRSRESRNEGKLIFWATAPAIVPNGPRIVEVFEEIAELSFLFSYEHQEGDPTAKIKNAWKKLALGMLDPDVPRE